MAGTKSQHRARRSLFVRVARPELDVDRERDRPGAGGLHRLVGLGLQILEFLDHPEPARHRDPLPRAVARRRVIGVEPRLAQWLDRLEAVHLRIEGLHEEEAAHLPVADDVDAGPLLIADRELGRVVERLFHVRVPVVARLDLVERGPEPAREAVAPHDVGGDRGQGGGHALLFIRGPGAWQWRRGCAGARAGSRWRKALCGARYDKTIRHAGSLLGNAWIDRRAGA